MSSISDTLAVREYKGDSIGGGNQAYGVITDPSPIDKLAVQTFYQKRDLWERKNKKDDEAALQIAKLTAIDPSNTTPEIYKYLVDKQKTVLDKLKNGIPDYQKDPQGYLDFHKAANDFKNLVQRAGATDVKLEKQRSLNAALDGNKKAAADNLLNASISKSLSGGVEKYLREGSLVETEYKPTVEDYDIKIPKDLKANKISGVLIGANNTIDRTVTFTDYSTLWQQAILADNKVDNFVDDPSKYTSKQDYDLEKAKYQIRVANRADGTFTQETVKTQQDIIKAYYQKKKEYDANPIGVAPEKPDFIKAFEEWNTHKKNIEGYMIATEGGKKLKHQMLPEFRLDDENGATLEELRFLKMVSKVDNSIGFDEKSTNTDTGYKYAALSASKADDNADNRLARDVFESGLTKDGLKRNGKGGFEAVINIGGKETNIADYAEYRKNELIKKVGSKEVLFSDLSADQQAYIDDLNKKVKTTKISSYNDATVKKVGDDFIITNYEVKDGVKTVKEKINITETDYKNTVNDKVNTVDAGKETGRKPSGTNSNAGQANEISGSADFSTYADGEYKVKDGKYIGKIIIIKNRQPTFK